MQPRHDGAARDDVGLHAVRVGERVTIDRVTVGCGAERLFHRTFCRAHADRQGGRQGRQQGENRDGE